MMRFDSGSNAGSRPGLIPGIIPHDADWHFHSDLVFPYGNGNFANSHRLQDQQMHLTQAKIGDTVRKVDN